MPRYLVTVLLALVIVPPVVAAEEHLETEVVILEKDNAQWIASHLSGGEYMDDHRRWVSARVQYVVGESWRSSSFAVRGCESGQGDAVVWSLEKPSTGEQLITMTPEVRFFWPDSGVYNTFGVVAAQLCRSAEAGGWFGR